MTGSSFSRNAFNSVYSCLEEIDGSRTSTTGPFICKHLAHETFLLPPGRHSLLLAHMWESGQHSSSGGKLVTVNLAAGQTYTVRAEEVEDPKPEEHHSLHVWLEDRSGAVLGGKLDMGFEDPEKVGDRAFADRQKAMATLYGSDEDRIYPMTRFNAHPLNPATLPPIHRLFVYSDFGNQSQPFEKAFSERFQAQMAGCGVGLKMMSVPHATKLSLDPPKKLPPDKDILALAAADDADYLLKIAVLEYSGPGSGTTDLSRPFTEGRFNIETVLLSASGGEIWHPTYYQPRVAKGGDAFADTLIQALGGGHGALPGCGTEGK